MNIKRIIILVVLASLVVGAVYLVVWVPMDLLLKVLAVCAAVLLFILGLFWKYRCGKCKRFWALGKTGRKSFDETPILAMDEWKCGHCGHTLWKKRPWLVLPGV